MTFPQIRCRTEFSFRQAYGQIPKVVAALKDLGAPAAGIVDGSTWGCVRWAKEMDKAGIKPLFGTEVAVPMADGRRPVSWALAQDTRQFFRFSTAARKKEMSPEEVTALFANAKGIIRFAGAALTDPESFDYVDVNPASAVQTRMALRLAKNTGKPLVVTSDNSYPRVTDFGAFMAVIARDRATPQHILNKEELRAALRLLDDEQFDQAIKNTWEVAERCADKLPSAPIIKVEGDLRAVAEEGKRKRLELGHIENWTDEYEKRLERELIAIEEKQYESYFLVVSDLVIWAKQHMLVGPGRGSSSGSLVCYLTFITEIDPIVHSSLLFERFIDVTRKDLPDIDIDFADTKRDMCFDYLGQRYGKGNVARIGNINTLKPRSVLNEVCRRFAIPPMEKFKVLDVLADYSSGDSRFGHGLHDTLTGTDNGKDFMRRYPESFVMTEVENHAWHTGVHAAGVIVSNEPVSDYCTVGHDGVAHIDKPDSEQTNLLKIDALGLRTLGLIEDSGVAKADELYALRMNDQNVFQVFNEKKYSCIFQFEGTTQRVVAEQIEVRDFETIDHITALARPGPLGGGATERYIARKAGREPVTFDHPKLEPVTRDTLGLILYQEQVMACVRELGRFSWEDTTIIRKAMSARKGKEFFDRKGEQFVSGAALEGIPAPEAKHIWQQLCDFGAWGMNRAHTCAYSKISYWTAWMKAYHPLEFAAACLRNARDDDNTLEILREMDKEGIQYVPFDMDLSEVNWSVKEGKLIGGFQNLDGFGPAKAVTAVEHRRLGTMEDKLRERIAKAKVKFTKLYPIHEEFGDMYDHPERYNIEEGSKIVTGDKLPLRGDVLYMCRVKAKSQRDENETLRIAKRNGEVLEPPTTFIDLHVTDDSGIPLTLRISRKNYVKSNLGPRIMEQVFPGDIILVRGWRIPNFSMISINKFKVVKSDHGE